MWDLALLAQWGSAPAAVPAVGQRRLRRGVTRATRPEAGSRGLVSPRTLWCSLAVQ